MNQRSSLGKKVGYGLAIVALLFVLSNLGAPATVDSPGGTLAKLRTENRLAQSQLGEIDPASETIKLATLGLRGLAVQFLWDRAVHFKKVEDWTNLTATLEQLAKLQPNFITFWKYQSWNLSYNVSVEFDDYHDRYYWVRRGIQFLQEGNEYNRDNPALQWELGWVLGQKIGRADEKEQYRRLFKADDEYHPEDRPPSQRDNWLVGKEAYNQAVASVDEKGQDLGKKSPSIFYSSSPKSQMNYAEAIENEGLFDSAVAAWKLAGEEWREFGNVPIEHSQGPILKFNEEEELTERVAELSKQLSEMLPGVEDRVREDGYAKLSDEQKAALELPPGERSDDQTQLAYQAEQLVQVTPTSIALKIGEVEPEKAREAKELAADINDAERRRRFTRNYKDTTNYDYWALRCEFEQTKAAVTARSLIYRAKRVFREDADPITAKELYEEAFAKWDEVFQQFPKLQDGDDTTGDDVMAFIYDYNTVLEQLDEQIPEDFPLWYIIENFDIEQTFEMQVRERAQREPEIAPPEFGVAAEEADEPEAEEPTGDESDEPTVGEEEAIAEDPGEAAPEPAEEPSAEETTPSVEGDGPVAEEATDTPADAEPASDAPADAVEEAVEEAAASDAS